MSYEEIKGYDGKRLKMQPFLMVWTSSNGKNLQWLTADSATLDMNQPIGLSNKQSSESIKVEHAVIEGDVRIRDDRGTPAYLADGTPGNLADDLTVEELTYLEYDDVKRLITSTSHVVIRDPDQTATGDGLEIQLRKPDVDSDAAPAGSSSGFGGVEYAILQNNPRVVMRDVGDSGFLPGGGARPTTTPKAASPAKTVDVVASATPAKDANSPAKKEPVPLMVQSQGPMRIDWPPDRLPVVEGPPEPPAPTLVRFERRVVAVHGRIDRDPNQLDCDTLRLTLVPGGPPRAARKGPCRGRGKDRCDERRRGQAGRAADCSRPGRPIRCDHDARVPCAGRSDGRNGRRQDRADRLGRWHVPGPGLGRRGKQGPLRQPRPPEGPRHRPRRLAPDARSGHQGPLHRDDP